MSMEYAPSSRPPGPDCIDRAAWGSPSAIVPQYIAKIRVENEDDYPKQDACTPYYYSAAQIDDFIVTNSLTGDCDITITGNIVASEVTAGGITLTSRKPFDIPHPTKTGYRLRHVCLEGPESGVYFRGRVTNRNEISYPSYWKGLVDWTTVTVNLTPVGSHQNVIVKRFDEEKIYLQSHGGMPIDCFYHVYGERLDGERLIVEYEGTSIDDYPGDNSIYSINK
jgi:hypothetical protein